MTQGVALFLSVLLELPVVVGLALLLGWVPREQLGRLLLVGAAATLLTHPFAWHGFPFLQEPIPNYWVRAVIIEGGVATVEGLLYAAMMGLPWWKGQVLGWAANGFSYGMGLVIFAVL